MGLQRYGSPCLLKYPPLYSMLNSFWLRRSAARAHSPSRPRLLGVQQGWRCYVGSGYVACLRDDSIYTRIHRMLGPRPREATALRGRNETQLQVTTAGRVERPTWRSCTVVCFSTTDTVLERNSLQNSARRRMAPFRLNSQLLRPWIWHRICILSAYWTRKRLAACMPGASRPLQAEALQADTGATCREMNGIFPHACTRCAQAGGFAAESVRGVGAHGISQGCECILIVCSGRFQLIASASLIA